ncbi:hypothetical protein NXH64_14445 [Butyrivibrio fibrisolvens]|uniref:hypothetical protein n=1 Tax=Pseudobutyrivibrio ruminis TaxID=46206 RepID=UPI00040D6649|nr:hypothetical protein [Pseudobutyrivibrio ruminis]MDC7280699.1 hypothetical protein [Butyrivibrio fibrisolvens]
MDLQTNVETITEQTQLFQSIAVILLALAIVFLIASIVIFIVFNIPHSFRVLTGMGMNKEMSRAAAGDRKRQKATLNWNTSGSLNKNVENETTILEDEETVILSSVDATAVLETEETTVLGCEETTLLGTEETTLLSDYEANNSLFEMEDDIKITGSNKHISL